MASKQMWFGLPGTRLQWVPCPLIASTIQRNRYTEQIQFDNGGGDARRSAQYQMQYNFAFSGLAHETDGIDAFNKFASGFYGDGLIYLAHPANFQTNMFAAAWATPALIEEGWKNIYPSSKPTFNPSGATNYGLPARSATWNITTAANTAVSKMTIVIPPTHTLNVGATGSVTGSGVVQVRPILVNNAYGSTSNLTLISTSSSTRMNATFSGSTYSAIEVYITRSADTAATVTLVALMAQLYKTGTTPTLPTSHYQGEGSTGLMFVDEAIVESYLTMTPPRKGISTTLVEVEAWRN